MTYNELKYTMNTNRKKTLSAELIDIANGSQVPPLYHTAEIEGIIVKHYPFFRGNSAIYNRKDPFPKLDITTNNLSDFTALSARKNELENQIELHRKYCVGQYSSIKLATHNWLNNIIQGCTDDLIDNSEMDRITDFMAQIWTMQHWIMLGVEMDVIRKDLKKSYSSTVQVDPVHYFPMNFDIDELIEKINTQVAAIERIVSRTVPLYFEYVNIQSIVYELDLEFLLETLESKNKLSTADSRIRFVEGFYFKNNGSQNPDYTWDDAVKDAKKQDSRIPYKNAKSFLNSRRNLSKRTK